MKILAIIAVFIVFANGGGADEIKTSANDRVLIEAVYRLRIDDVKKLLKDGANPNARFGDHDADTVFQDPWDLGWPMAYPKWTALLALSEASEWPPPPRKIENTAEDFEFRLQEAAKVPEKELEKRREIKVQIGKLLIQAGADVNVDDGYGATPLYNSAAGKSDLLLLLVEHGARVISKTGVYIDGPGDETPMHLAIHSPDNLAILIHEGAALNATDSEGNTALHRAVQADELASVKLLLDAGVDQTIKNKIGKLACELCNTHEWASVKELAISRLFSKKQEGEQAGADQPASQPGDKPPVKDQPSSQPSNEGSR